MDKDSDSGGLFVTAGTINFLSEQPAPGYRGLGDGTLWSVGNSGFSRASTVSGISGMYLNFGVTWLNPSDANNHGYGFQLRCLSE